MYTRLEKQYSQERWGDFRIEKLSPLRGRLEYFLNSDILTDGYVLDV